MIKPLAAALVATTWSTPPLPADHSYSSAECPVAANVDSGIYHLVGSHHHRQLITHGKARPLQVACFPTEADALGAGYRKPRR